jgi:D-arabinose 5-phosphate isomerase GutQ
VRTGYAYYGLAGEPQTLIEDLSNVSTSQLDADKRTLYAAGNITKSLTGVLNGTLNTTVRVTTESVGSAITFVHNSGGETTTSRIITSTGANVTISGSGKTATLLSTANGWYLTV